MKARYIIITLAVLIFNGNNVFSQVNTTPKGPPPNTPPPSPNTPPSPPNTQKPPIATLPTIKATTTSPLKQTTTVTTAKTLAPTTSKSVTSALLTLNLQNCDSSPTCSPIKCFNVTNTACTLPSSTINVPVAVSKSYLTCTNSCTQSTLSLCSSSNLTRIFSKGLAFGIKAIYCTDQYLVVHSDGTPNHNDTLKLIPRPPGGGTGSYSSSCVTRARVGQFYSFKIPLNPVALNTSSGTVNNVNSFIGNMLGNGIALPVAGPAAFTITGMPIFPPYNNVGQLTWTACEVDSCNAHVGQGFDYHYHGDPYGPKCMYSSADYTSTSSHPPLIGFGADGFPLYGRYLSTSAEGYSIALDECGGHSHGAYGYHYHSQVLTLQITSQNPMGLSLGQNYTAYIPGPYKCWKGDISKFKNFWDTRGLTVAFGNGLNTPSNLPQRSDYASVQPCCKMTNFYQATGVNLST